MDLKNYKIKIPEKKFNYRWQVLADEMTTYFKRNSYWLFYKYPEHKIELAYKACKEKGIDSLQYLFGILKK
jgi:hypothetical protein